MSTRDALIATIILLLFVIVGLITYFHPKYSETLSALTEIQELLINTETQLSIKNEEVLRLNEEVVKLRSEISSQSEVIERYADSFGNLVDVAEPFTVPSNVSVASIGTKFDLPMKFQSGDAGNLAVKVTKIKKYLPETIAGKNYVYTETCLNEITDCDPRDSIPEQVSPNEAIISISLNYTNDTKNQTAYVVVADKFLAVVGDNKYKAFGSYLARNITNGNIERFNKSVFYVAPLSSYNHNLLIRVPVDTKEIILTYGLDLENQNKALTFKVE